MDYVYYIVHVIEEYWFIYYFILLVSNRSPERFRGLLSMQESSTNIIVGRHEIETQRGYN